MEQSRVAGGNPAPAISLLSVFQQWTQTRHRRGARGDAARQRRKRTRGQPAQTQDADLLATAASGFSPLSPRRRFAPQHRRLTCESLYEDEEFVQRQLLALVAPKVFLYLTGLIGALSHALGAGSLFDVSDNSDYAQTLLAKALGEYAAIQSSATGKKKRWTVAAGHCGPVHS